jgi:hypothetical protein
MYESRGVLKVWTQAVVKKKKKKKKIRLTTPNVI